MLGGRDSHQVDSLLSKMLRTAIFIFSLVIDDVAPKMARTRGP
jgi:hypothetical protein